MRTLCKERVGKNSKLTTEILRPILFISQLAGMCAVKTDGKTVSRLFLIIQIVTIVVNVLHLIWIPFIISSTEGNKVEKSSNNQTDVKYQATSAEFIAKLGNPMITSSTAVILRISTLIKLYMTLPQLLKVLDNVDQMVTGRNDNNAKWIMISSVCAIIISWPFQIFSLVITESTFCLKLMLLFNMYNNFSAVCCEFQFLSVCWIIKSRYGCINRELKTLCLTGCDTIPDGYCTKICNCTKDSPVIKPVLNARELEKIVANRKIHRMLNKACVKLNSLYDCQILVMLVSSAANVLFNLYFAIFGGFVTRTRGKSEDITSQNIRNVVNDVVWSLYYFRQLVFICFAAGLAAKTANYTKSVICDLISQSRNKTMKHELWEYLTYTMANKIKFSACDFFKVDVALITSAVATGATYLVILAQFHSHP